MGTYKIQIVISLAAVAFGSAARAESPNALPARGSSVSSALLSTPNRQSQNSPVKAAQPSPGVGQTPPFWSAGTTDDPNRPRLAPNRSGTRELFFKMILSVLLVVGLGAVAIYASKKLTGKITNLPGKKIKLVETVYIGPRKAVHLITVGDRCLLIASTNENITKLADLTTDPQTQEKVLGEDSGSRSQNTVGGNPSHFAETLKMGPSTEFESCETLSDL